MIEAVIRWSVHNRIMVLLVTVMLAGAGLWSLLKPVIPASLLRLLKTRSPTH